MSNDTKSKRNSKMSSNSQGVDLSDLLNFSLPPRQARPVQHNVPRRSKKPTTTQAVWNKERFVNAQYRFVMNPHGDYTVHFADPDIYFQWQDVLQIIIPRSSALASATTTGELSSQEEGCTTCPICLSPPTVPRMTKCGHVFCLPCILHYLSMSNNNWARCPICFDSINDAQLKSVKWYDGSVASSGDNKEGIQSEGSSTSSTFGETLEAVPQAGSSLTMRLIERPQITTLALPRSPTWPSDLLPPHQAPYHFLPDVYNFAKFMLATPAYLISDLTRDLDALETERAYLTSINDALSLIFVEGAEQRVRDEVSKAVGLETPILKSKIERSQRELQELEERQEVEKLRRKASEFIGASGGALSDAPKELLASRGLDAYDEADPSRPPSQTRINIPRQRKNVNPPPPTNSTYYYYQAASGLPLFLHPLDIKILLSHFRSYSSFPDVISIRVASVSEGTVNNDLQKRCKYLGHLPEGTDVVFIEADLKDVVGAEGLKNFEGPLKMRAARRKDKAKKDERARTRAEERERERIHAEAWSPPSTTTMHTTSYTDNAEDFPAPESESLPVSSSPPRQPTGGNGAWGNRTFASALHSSSPTSHSQRPGVGQHGRRGEPLEDEFDLDIDWHERVGNPGRNKRGTKIVLLGSGGAGARRR